MALKDELLGDLLGEVDTDEVDMSDMDALLQAALDEEDTSSSDEEKSSDAQDVVHLSQEEINKMLLESQQMQMPMPKIEEESTDLKDLLGAVEDNVDLQDIGSMLERSDNNEAVNEDVVSLLENVSDTEEGKKTEAFDIFSEEEPVEETKEEAKARKAAEKQARKEAKKAAKQEKKNKNKKKKKNEEENQTEGSAEEAGTVGENAKSADAPVDIFADSPEEATEDKSEELQLEEDKTKEKKKGLLHKFKDFLMEEDEEEDESKSLNLSDENAAILEDMKKEDKKKEKGSKKKKKGKKEQKGSEAAEGEEGGEEGEKGKKKKKEKKPKKEKTPKDESLVEESKGKGKKLPIKKVIMIGLLTASIMAVLLVMVNLTGDYSERKSAVTSYYKGDYQNTYQNLFGKNLNESEQVMFHKSEYILRMRLNKKEYERLEEQCLKVEALDSLIQTITEYPELYQNASQWNAEGEVQQIYNQLLQSLQENYNLTEVQAQEISAEPDDIEYTKTVIAIANGTSYTKWQDDKDRISMQGVLPEEEEFGDTSFLDSGF